MTDARRQLKNAKKLARLRLVEHGRASMEAAETRENLRSADEALSAAKHALEAGDASFSTESPRWSSISDFEAALAKRNARTDHARAQARAAQECEQANELAIENLRAHDARLSAAEQLVLVHRRRLQKALERLEQTLTDDLSVLKKSREP